MSKKIAILRGINVGGKRKILMADLKALCEKIGLENITTYIQSGNIIFNSKLENSELEDKLEESIKERFGFIVPVIVRNSIEIRNSIDKNPFYHKNADINKLHLTFLKEQPSQENLAKVNSFNFEPDKFEIAGKDVFLYCDGKYHQTKLNNTFFEKKLNVGATTRNWKTVLKLFELGKD